VLHLALRQTEGLIGSIIGSLGLTLAVPDHSTLSRRAETLDVPRLRRGIDAGGESVHLLVDSTGLKLRGAGEWLVEKHEATFIAHALDGLCRSEKVLWKPLPVSVV